MNQTVVQRSWVERVTGTGMYCRKVGVESRSLEVIYTGTSKYYCQPLDTLSCTK